MILSSLVLAFFGAWPVIGALQYRGVDWSSLLFEERWTSHKNSTGFQKPLEDILVEAGVNFVRQRVWVTDGDYGLDYNLELAQRAKAAGLGFGLNLHLSNDWSNPERQDIPPGWPTDNVCQLAATMYNYVLDLCNTFQAADLQPGTITLGNEINNGILFPVGSIQNPENFSRLLKVASQAVRDSALSPQPKLLLHITSCCTITTPETFYDTILNAGPLTLDDFDVQAVSLYPFWGPLNTFTGFREMATWMQSEYGKEIQIVETNFPIECTEPDYEWPADVTDIPLSIEGQEIYIERMAAALEDVGGTGLNYWEAAWSLFPNLGSPCEHATMFDNTGRAFDSLSVFGRI